MIEAELTAPTWTDLEKHYNTINHIPLREFTEADRFKTFSREIDGLLFNFSRNHITQKTLSLLLKLAQESFLEPAILDLFQGKIVNVSEQRAALHTALRTLTTQPNVFTNKDILQNIARARSVMFQIAEKVRNKQWLGYSNKPITDVVNIGIGGSHLGSYLTIEALEPYTSKDLNYHFISNVDPSQITSLLKKINAETTLFIIVSKTFTTRETLFNAQHIKTWLESHISQKDDLKKHFLAVTAHAERALDFGICSENILPLWDWVGGRYSVWSCVGLIAAIALGEKYFTDFLMGAHQIDIHFQHTDFQNNIPILMSLLNIWYTNFFKTETRAILPYCSRLRLLPHYLQQLSMESNGKSCQQNGAPTKHETSPIIWGGVGTEGQHAFHQLLFQGTHRVPSDFIVIVNDVYQSPEQHKYLFANALAQAQLLMNGEDNKKIEKELLEQGHNKLSAELLAKQKMLTGNQPSNFIVLDELSPRLLGCLIALYEHKTFVESVIWKTNCFDQWGVESGKKIAQKIYLQLNENAHDNKGSDDTTDHLIHYFLQHFMQKID